MSDLVGGPQRGASNTSGAPLPPLDRVRLLDLVQRERPWSDLVVLEEAGSTNAVAAARADAAPPGLVVVAEHQTAGRGRLDRVWVTPPRSSVTVSVLLRPSVPARRWLWLPLLAGVATVEALRRSCGVEARLKWPNDVQIAGLKTGGILVERLERTTAPVAVVGIGINVSLTRDQLPVPEATSLSLASGQAVDRTDVLATLLAELGREYLDWEAVGGDPDRGLRERYSSRCATLGARVTASLPSGETITGTARDVDAEGMLVIETPSGVETVAAGDVTHLRPVE